MRAFISLFALAAVLAFGPLAEARAPGRKPHVHTGTVVSVEAHELVVEFEGKNGKPHRHHVLVGARTRVTLNGKLATLSSLRAGDRVKVVGGHKKPARSVAAER